MKEIQKEHFKGFNTLRFFAAFLVVIHHSETIRKKYLLPNFDGCSLFNNASLAVQFFFVLSGFLITYLLLNEYKFTNKINIKQFYIRRILRIWPLYFIMVILGVYIVPMALNIIHFQYVLPYKQLDATILYTLFLPFLINYFYGTTMLDVLWSIGVEEQFYLIWAPLVHFFRKNILTIFIAIILSRGLLQIYFLHFNIGHSLINFLLEKLQFDMMSIGGLGAYFIFNRREKVLGNQIFSKPSQIFLFSSLIVILFFNSYFMNNAVYQFLFNTIFISPLVIGFLFLWFLINISLNTRNIIKLQSPFFEKLGEYSYGIYMYHMLIVFLVILLLKNKLNNMGLISGSILYYAITIVLIIIVAYISNTFIEKRFLQLKSKFEPKE